MNKTPVLADNLTDYFKFIHDSGDNIDAYQFIDTPQKLEKIEAENVIDIRRVSRLLKDKHKKVIVL